MAHPLIEIITSADPQFRNQSLDAICANASGDELLAACAELDAFRRRSENLYERVRALFFLYAIHRFHLPAKISAGADGMIPFKGFEHLLQRRFEEALEQFLTVQKTFGPSDAVSSALANVYQRIAFQTLADQVRRSVAALDELEGRVSKARFPADQIKDLYALRQAIDMVRERLAAPHAKAIVALRR